MRGAGQTFPERTGEFVVRAAIVVNAKLSRLVRPGSFVILAFVSLFAVGTLMKGTAFPSEDVWKSGSLAVYGLVLCGAVTYLGYFLVIWGYGRLLKAKEKDDELYRACRDVASLVERTTGLDRAKIGVHVWAVRGLRGARRLERRATFVPGTRPPTAIVWRRGKGAIGRCWERDEWILADLEELHRFRDPRQRPGLAALLRIGDDELDELVESCYRHHLEFDRNRFWGGLPATFLLPDGSEA